MVFVLMKNFEYDAIKFKFQIQKLALWVTHNNQFHVLSFDICFWAISVPTFYSCTNIKYASANGYCTANIRFYVKAVSSKDIMSPNFYSLPRTFLLRSPSSFLWTMWMYFYCQCIIILVRAYLKKTQLYGQCNKSCDLYFLFV